jgi:hypothetical protein
MFNTDLMTGVSIETLGAMLLSSIFLAEFALGETSPSYTASVPAGPAVAPRVGFGRAPSAPEATVLGQYFDAGPRAANMLKRAERSRGRGLSRCVSRARERRAIRIRGRR